MLSWCAWLVCGTGCMPFVWPPSRLTLGPTALRTVPRAGRSYGSAGVLVRYGVHPLDAIPSESGPRRFDIGVGYQTEELPHFDESRARERPAHGPYLEAGYYPVLAQWSERNRVQAGGYASVEALWKGSEFGIGESIGGTIDLSHDVESEFADDNPEVAGVAAGRWSIGLFTAATYRQFPDQQQLGVSGGVSVRIPMSAGLLCCAWSGDGGSVHIHSGGGGGGSTRLERRSAPPARTPAAPRRKD